MLYNILIVKLNTGSFPRW